MSEKEKMLSGEMYNANYDSELIKERNRAKVICQKYNKAKASKLKYRTKVLQKLFNTQRNDFLIEQPFLCDYGYNVSFGKRFYANHNLVILDCNKVTFGNDVFIGPNCGFYTAEHPIDVAERNQGLEYAKPITVGNNVWIGGNVVVLSGVTIGDNVVIGAGSVVVNDIPSNVVAVGNPCRIIKKID